MKVTTQTNYGAFFKAWPLRPLQEVAFFQEGPGLRKWQWTEEGMKVINVTNIIGDGSVDTSNTARFISVKEFEDKYSHFAVENDDIVVASSGNTYGKVGRVNQSHLPIMMNTSVIRFHPLDSEQLHPNFLYAFLRSTFFRNQVESQVIGSAQPNFGPSHLKRMQIPVPSLGEQEKIAGILSAYDDLIENNTRRIAVLEEMAQSLYREWFVRFRFLGHEQVGFIETEQGRVPEGWPVVRVGEAVEINPTTKVPREGDKPFVSMGAVPHNTMLIDTALVEQRTGNSGSKFKNGDTLFARITPCLENGKTAFVQFLPSQSDVAFGSTEFIVLRTRTVTPEFVYLMARSDSFRDNAIKSMSGASGRQRVHEGCFEKYFLALPDPATLAAFSEIAGPLFRQIHLLAKKNRNLRCTRDLLLTKLTSGELDVEHLDIDTGDPVAATEGQP